MYLIFDIEFIGKPCKWDTNTQISEMPRCISFAWNIYEEGILKKKNHFHITPYKLDTKAMEAANNSVEIRYPLYGTPIEKVFGWFIEDARKCDFMVGYDLDTKLDIIRSELYRLHLITELKLYPAINFHPNRNIELRNYPQHYSFWIKAEENFEAIFVPNTNKNNDLIIDSIENNLAFLLKKYKILNIMNRRKIDNFVLYLTHPDDGLQRIFLHEFEVFDSNQKKWFLIEVQKKRERYACTKSNKLQLIDNYIDGVFLDCDDDDFFWLYYKSDFHFATNRGTPSDTFTGNKWDSSNHDMKHYLFSDLLNFYISNKNLLTENLSPSTIADIKHLATMKKPEHLRITFGCVSSKE
ncbi:MAG: hypothetical protein H6584_06345 [Flavobacteriales bacterium]|nr:hypothetical protein [Flavobacteriales bacterium]